MSTIIVFSFYIWLSRLYAQLLLLVVVIVVAVVFAQLSDVVLFFSSVYSLRCLFWCFVFVWCWGIKICDIYIIYIHTCTICGSTVAPCCCVLWWWCYLFKFLYFVKIFCECVRTRVSARKNFAQVPCISKIIILLCVPKRYA